MRAHGNSRACQTETLHSLHRDLFLLMRHDITCGEAVELIIKREGNTIPHIWKFLHTPWLPMHNSCNPKYKTAFEASYSFRKVKSDFEHSSSPVARVCNLRIDIFPFQGKHHVVKSQECGYQKDMGS